MDPAPPVPYSAQTWCADEDWFLPHLNHVEEDVFSFSHERTFRARRAWEREPKTAFAPHQKGRKVWKRYGLRSTEGGTTSSEILQSGDQETSTSSRAIKRLCLKQPSILQSQAYASKPSEWLATLQEKSLGTPRRKVAKRKSLRLNKVDGDSDNISGLCLVNTISDTKERVQMENPPSNGTLPISARYSNKAKNSEPGPTVEETLLDRGLNARNRAYDLYAGALVVPNEDTRVKTSLEQPLFPGLSEDIYLKPDRSAKEPGQGAAIRGEATETVLANQSDPVTSNDPHETIFACSSIPASCDMNEENHVDTALGRTSGRQSGQAKDNIILQTQLASSTSHYGVHLLESEYFGADNTADSSGMPEGEELKCPLEVDIIALTNPTQSLITSIVTSDSDKYRLQTECRLSDHSPRNRTSCSSLVCSTYQEVREQVVHGTQGTSTSPEEQESVVARRSRSGSRYSDDTSMLKDFLHRAQAKKAAQSVEALPAPGTVKSPRRSPRKVLGQLDSNSPSPTKSRDSTNRSRTPPSKVSLGTMGSGQVDEPCKMSTACRRSARKHQPMQEKATFEPLSFIPVRRPEGSESVMLQKSVAQELAVTTRANTRRNKASAKLPKILLETLVGVTVEEAPAKQHETRSTKSVDWDSKLVYFHAPKDCNEGKEEKAGIGPKIRRLKRLGAVNGTPVAKRSSESASPSNGTPAPRRRGKTKA
ncbi:hypothetical protein MMC13_002899 [Lambiella insularis]|nr:hypothetical protein [Lambiella insularis]